jgi:hypothetical protein
VLEEAAPAVIAKDSIGEAAEEHEEGPDIRIM